MFSITGTIICFETVTLQFPVNSSCFHRTALHLVCANGHSAVVTLLLERKCLLNLCDNENRTALMKDDLTPLLLVICERRGQMVEFLVKKEANIHVVDKMKRTALMLVVKYESANVIRLLIQQGADIYSQDDFGWTAEEYAVVSGFNIRKMWHFETREHNFLSGQ
uniref:Uncharacterized protein n=1 Tax=Bos mutus grunniens TaxID=30521 RepID=A0A8B9YAG3_BOSMU